MLNSFRARSNCEIEAKFIQDRIGSVERQIAELCFVFAQYNRKAARLRDKGDELAKVLLNYAEGENINKSLNVGLENFADSISTLSDYGDARVQRLEAKVVNEFSRYEDICKQAKDEVKHIYSAREKEVNRKKQLERIRERNPRNRQQIAQAETDVVKATAQVSKTIHSLEEKTATFEKQKLHDIKAILLDFLMTELGYHAKALEVLTKAYQHVAAIDEESDLQEFKKSLRLPETIQHRAPRTSLFRSSQSLGSLGALFSSSHDKKSPARSPGIPRPGSKNFKSEETLDSMKHSLTDTEESHSDETEDVSDITTEDDIIRPRRNQKQI